MTQSITRGATVQVEYTVKDDTGHVLDSNKGQEPLTYIHGQKEIVPGLEQALEGMAAGQAKQVTVQPQEGYGMPDPSAVAEVPRDIIPPTALNVGTQLTARSQSGDTAPVWVKEIRDETVVLDLNHPLAGKTLHFDVRVLRVESPAR